MTKRSLLVVTVVLVLVAAAGVGVYFGTDWFRKPNVVNNPVEIDPNKERGAIPVPNVQFADVTDAARISFTHYNGAAGQKLLPETMGGGVCVLDYDRDGWQDILFVNSCPWPGHPGPEKPAASCLTLYRNKGDGTFEDVTEAAGLTVDDVRHRRVLGDYDNDGFPDLFITGVGGCKLYRNIAGENGKRKFVDATGVAGIAVRGAWPGGAHRPISSSSIANPSSSPVRRRSSTTTATASSISSSAATSTGRRRSILSIKGTLTGIGRSYLRPQEFEGAQCALYRNLGGGRFEDVTEAAGVSVFEGEGIGPRSEEAARREVARRDRLRPRRRRLARPHRRQRHGAQLLLSQRSPTATAGEVRGEGPRSSAPRMPRGGPAARWASTGASTCPASTAR